MTESSSSGRIALVTGSSSGIGYATAVGLARTGAHIIAAAVEEGGLHALASEIGAAGGQITVYPIDLTDFGEIKRLATFIEERFGRLDVLVGNAGMAAPMTRLSDTELASWLHIIALNVSANFQLIRCLETLLRQSASGRAVFTTSSVAHRAPAQHGPYSTSKAALDTLVRVWAKEVADTPIRANLFSPGPVRTQMRTTIIKGEDPETLPTPKQIAEYVVPMCLPSWAETGGIFDFRARKTQFVQPPA